MPIAIVTIGIGLLFLVRRRPTVVRPPTAAPRAKTDAIASAPTRDESLQDILGDLRADIPPGDIRRLTILKGRKQVGWTVTRRLDTTSLSPDDLGKLVGGGSVGKLAGELLEKFGADAVATNAPPEAGLQFPGSSLVLSSVEAKQTAGSFPGFLDVRKTTFATEASGDQVLAWYQDWLVAHGWQPAAADPPAATSSHQYARGSEHFRLAIGDPATIRDIVAVPIPEGAKTVYEVEYGNASTEPTESS